MHISYKIDKKREIEMLVGIEDIMCELASEEEINSTGYGCPPGFRFHPTDEELISYYLASKVFHHGSSSSWLCPLDIIPEVDLNKCEPWELPDEAKMGKREWYFYSLRDRKYPTGLRTNRATSTGYWKATGKDKEIHIHHNAIAAPSGNVNIIGMKKTLVFYLGRAPRGEKTKWVMHEYRLHAHSFFRAAAKEEWVICRIHHKTGEKKNMLMNEIGTTSSSMRRNDNLLLDHHLMISGQFLQNQASAVAATDYTIKHNSKQMLFGPLFQSQLGPFPAYNFQNESSYYSNPAITAATSANSTTSCMLMIKSLLSTQQDEQHQLANIKYVSEQVRTEEPNYFSTQPHLLPLPGADGNDFQGFHDLQQASSSAQFNPHNAADDTSDAFVRETTNSDHMDSSRGGCCLQMVVDPNFRIPAKGQSSWPLDA